MNLYNWPGEL